PSTSSRRMAAASGRRTGNVRGLRARRLSCSERGSSCGCRPCDGGRNSDRACLRGAGRSTPRAYPRTGGGPRGGQPPPASRVRAAAATTGVLRSARLVAAARVPPEARPGRLLVRPAAALAGLIEVRGLGVRRLDYEPVAVVGLLVDLAAEDAERLPAPSEAVLLGVPLRRLALPPGADALAPVLALLRSPGGDIKPPS